MRAIGLLHSLAAGPRASLVDIEMAEPAPGPLDLRVVVEAISVNPVDAKMRARAKAESTPRVLGWDAAGIVDAVGDQVASFRPGDRVYYAGSLQRPGSNAEKHIVDARLVGAAPRSVSAEDAAALPLTALTAWEGLFERLRLSPTAADAGKSLLVIGGAGGVGSMVIQLAKVAGLRVFATASRKESSAWAKELGADVVIDHGQPLRPQIEAGGLSYVDAIFNTQSTEAWWNDMADLVAPQGRIVGIVDGGKSLDLDRLKSKSATFAWEFMFTRSQYETPDMAEQGRILSRVAALLDEGRLRSTRRETLGRITAENLRRAHVRIEEGRTTGKIVLAGWT